MSTAALSLYQVESDLEALLDTEEGGIPAEVEAEFRAALSEQMQTTVAKRDRVAEFIRSMDAQAKLAAEESKRLSDRGRQFERAAERMRAYVLEIIGSGGWLDSKGKPRKLEGAANTFSTKANPPSVEIFDANAVPAEYKTITLTLSAEEWFDHLALYAEMHRMLGGLSPIREVGGPPITRIDSEVSKSAIKAEIERAAAEWEAQARLQCSERFYDSPEEEKQTLEIAVLDATERAKASVPGARLVTGKRALVLR